MKTATINAQAPKVGGIARKGHLYLLTLLLVSVGMAQSVRAETITIGKGTGIIWEGMPYNERLSGPLDNAYMTPGLGLLSVSNRIGGCARSADVIANIAGYKALQIAPGVGLIPRASGSVSFVRYDGTPDSITGTIGLPVTMGVVASGLTVFSPISYEWCLPAGVQDDRAFYKADGERVAQLAGTWALVADGTQVSGEAIIPPMYFGSFAYSYLGDKYVAILPASITLRISTLECTVSTPTMINFGSVERLTQVGAELATYSSPITTACSQASDRINANINLQFRALTSLYENQPTRLALAQGGGYITGEIDNGVTGSGVCTGTSGLPFDNSVVKIGNILTTEATTVINNQVTWRLCSGGASLPVGKVNASAEMLVTFN
ncbi:hypothetical protein [Yersinia mollaretii]|uniref:hypothetical protein n=1 Tax=Yersinia mollaretii TaxID=33060 RepID=UPI0021BD9764|nr:hypothetical protein [Yersinia mollaretii]